MAPWRLARSLETLRNQVNELYPDRDRSSDGTIGDLAHSRRSSDHNPDPFGVVHAIDITHDPAHGCDAQQIADAIRTSADRRVKYVIHHGQIFSSIIKAWEWRKYLGPNPHDHHVHISVKDSNGDDPSGWEL